MDAAHPQRARAREPRLDLGVVLCDRAPPVGGLGGRTWLSTTRDVVDNVVGEGPLAREACGSRGVSVAGDGLAVDPDSPRSLEKFGLAHHSAALAPLLVASHRGSRRK